MTFSGRTPWVAAATSPHATAHRWPASAGRGVDGEPPPAAGGMGRSLAHLAEPPDQHRFNSQTQPILAGKDRGSGTPDAQIYSPTTSTARHS